MKKTLLSISFLLLGFFAINAQIDYIGIVGDATPVGWNPLGIQLEQNDIQFTYKGVLKAGEVKFHAENSSDWGGRWIMAPNSGDDFLSASSYIITDDGTDQKWTVATAGSYSVTIDTVAKTIQVVQLDYYPNLALVGDATPGGWSLDNASDMTVDETNNALFTWTGNLTVGGFKIATAKTFDDGWDWIMPQTDGQDLSLNTYQVVVGGSGIDYKWAIAEADTGTYKITIDLENDTINIAKVPVTSVEEIYVEKLLKNTFVYEELFLNSSVKGNYSIYNMNGTKVKSGVLLSDKINVSVISTGFYILKIESPDKVYSEKFYKN